MPAQQRAPQPQYHPGASQTRRELCQQSRDLSGLVKQVTAILPQFSPDLVCEALIQKDEDVEATVEYLLNSSFETKVGKKKKKKLDGQGQVPSSTPELKEETVADYAAQTAQDDHGVDGAGYGAGEERDEAEERGPLLPSEKQALKLKKKLREIERIEEKLARNEKVDKMQLPKLEKKQEIEYELLRVQEVIVEEERQRELDREQARLEAEVERQRLQAEADARAAAAAAAAAAEEAERRRQLEEEAERQRFQQQLLLQQQQQQDLQRREEERRLQEEQQRRQHEEQLRRLQEQSRQEQQQQQHRQQHPQSWQQQEQPAAARQQDAKGMELLSMLHKTPQPASYRQAERLAQDLGGGRLRVQRFPGAEAPVSQQAQPQRAAAPQQPPQPQQPPPHGQQPLQRAAPAQHGASTRWDDQTTWAEEVDEATFMNEYSTPLDVSSIPLEKRRLAEKIAKEIEGPGAGAGGGDRHEAWRHGSSGGKGGGGYGGHGYGGYGHGSYGGGHTERKGGGFGKGDSKGKGKAKGKSEGGPAGSGSAAMPTSRLNW